MPLRHPLNADAEAVGGRDRSNRLALAALCTLLFLTFLDNTIVSVGLGNIQTDLKASVADLQWVVGGYALTFASLMLACGMIGDELGRKKVMLTGAGVFCAGSVLCALAPNAQTLIAGRAIMGMGAAASEPGTLSVLRHIYTDDRARARAVGVWAAVSGLALAMGPVIGGALIGAWSWRGIFWFNLFFGLAALLVAAVVVPESSDHRQLRVDTLGTVLGAGALATLVFAVIDAETSSFARPLVVGLLCAAFVLAVAFVLWERRAPNPLLDVKLFRSVWFTVPNVVAFCTYFATFAIFFFTALYLDEVVMASGYRIALVFAPMTVLMIVSSLLAGYLTSQVGPRWLIVGRLRRVRGRAAAGQPADHSAPELPAARAGPGAGRHRHRHHGGAGHLDRAQRGGSRALGDGRLRHQHQPGDRRRHRRRGPRRARVLPAQRLPHQPPAGTERPGGREDPDPRLQVDDHLVHRDRPGAHQVHRLRLDREPGDRRGLRLLRPGPARRALPVGRPRHPGRPAGRGHAWRTPARCRRPI